MEAQYGGMTLNINLSPEAYDELQQLSNGSGCSTTEIIRLGMGFVRLAIEAAANGDKIVLCQSDGRPLKELILPRTSNQRGHDHHRLEGSPALALQAATCKTRIQ